MAGRVWTAVEREQIAVGPAMELHEQTIGHSRS